MTTRADLVAALRAHWLAVVVFLLLAVIHTWPMATNPGVLSRNDNVVAILLTAVALWYAIRAGAERSRVVMIVAIGLVGFILSPHAVVANAEYVVNSTAHWRPLMNGYSGYTPESYRHVAWTFWCFRRSTRSRRCATPA